MKNPKTAKKAENYLSKTIMSTSKIDFLKPSSYYEGK